MAQVGSVDHYVGYLKVSVSAKAIVSLHYTGGRTEKGSHGIILGPRKVASYSDVTGPVLPPLSGDKVAIMLADPSNCCSEDQGTLFLSWNLPRLQSEVSRPPASLMLIVLTQCTAANEWVTKGAAPAHSESHTGISGEKGQPPGT
jgi:hypothetical protein